VLPGINRLDEKNFSHKNIAFFGDVGLAMDRKPKLAALQIEAGIDYQVVDSLQAEQVFQVVLPQPIEEIVVTISCAKGTLTFSANFIFIWGMNTCECGNGSVRMVWNVDTGNHRVLRNDYAASKAYDTKA
jgi:hypothetical protein